MATLISRSALGSSRNVAFVSRSWMFPTWGPGSSRSGTAIQSLSSSTVHRSVAQRKSLGKLTQKRWMNSSTHQKNEHSTTQSSESLLSGSNGSNSKTTFWQRFLAPKPMPERNTIAWYRELALICTVFGITGSATMFTVRPAVTNGLGIKGSMIDGPWSYRICSLVLITPVYATLLVVVGTIFGRHAYFRHLSIKILSRFGIPPEALDKSFHETKKTFRKW